MDDRGVTLTLSKAEALVFFEWLARNDKATSPAFEHPAEQAVLWALEAQLEKTLVEPFAPQYEQLVAKARRQVSGG